MERECAVDWFAAECLVHLLRILPVQVELPCRLKRLSLPNGPTR